MNPTQNPHVIGTSASNAAADRLCEGRFQASRNLPDLPNEWSDFGTKVHAVLADSGNPSLMQSLTPEQRDMFDAHREIEKKVINDIWGGEPSPDNKVEREIRYWCRVPGEVLVPADGSGPGPTREHKEKVFFQHSGQADMVMRRSGKALIQDYKSLAGDVAESPRNEQLRDLAVMVARAHGLNEVYVCINQPLVTWNPEVCKYTKEDLDQAEKEMWDRVRKSNAPNAPRTAGEVQCKWCKAKSVCKEYAAWSSSLLPEKPSPFTTAMQEWSLEQKSIVAEHLPRLRKLLDDADDFLKACLKIDPESVPGFYLKPGNTRETINNPQELFNRFSAMGGQLDQFMSCVKITKKELEAQVRAVTETKGKALKSKVSELLAGIVDATQNEPSLARKDPS